MLNIDKQIKHWRDGSLEEWEVASELIGNKRIRHGLFWAHLALEKMLKAHVCRQTGDIAPRIHNLTRLCELAGLSMNPEQVKFLTKMNKYNIEGRYIEHQAPVPPMKTAKEIMLGVEEMLQWLNKMF